VRDALGDLLSLVDLGDLLLEELVSALADVDNLCSLSAPSWMVLIDGKAVEEGSC
jgi:hypothetical protein